MNTNDGGPAFPAFSYAGMTLRDYFAAKAMEALISNSAWPTIVSNSSLDVASSILVSTAFQYADQMLKKRNEPIPVKPASE